MSRNPEEQTIIDEIDNHRFIVYDDNYIRGRAVTNKLAAYILNKYTRENLSVTQYKKRETITITNTSITPNQQYQFRFDRMVNHIYSTGSFNEHPFHLPPFKEYWLDNNLEMVLLPASPGLYTESQTHFPNFPVRPRIEREGLMYTSFQAAIQKNISHLHETIINESNTMFNMLEPQWLNNLRMLLNESVSVIDITLHQLYFAAQYQLKPNWTFDQNRLGVRHGVRISDKLHWIGEITGRPLGDAKEEVESFNFLRGIRNHFNHFDPPCVAFTVDDVVDWLNRIPQIGYLLWKIRDKMDAQLNPDIVKMILLPRVIVNPRYPESDRPQQPSDSGYATSRWP